MTRNPKYDQFQSKGHHNEENPQSTTKCMDTKIWPVSLSHISVKIRKINKLWSWSNRFWRWSGYISMQNVRPFPQWVLQERVGNPRFDPFHYVKIVPKLEKSTDHDHNLISSEGGQVHQRAEFQAIPFESSPGNVPRPQIWHISLGQNSIKIKKITRPCP